MSKKIKKTNKDEYDFDQLWVELNQTQSISYLVRAKVEQNLSLILSNISAAFTGNRTLANQNTTDIKYNLLEVFNSLDKSDLSKKEIEDYKKLIEYKFLQNANNLNLLMQEISDEMKKANQKMIKISEKIMTANQGVIDFNKSMKLDPNNHFTYEFRADTKQKMGDQYGAISDYSEAIKLKPNDSYAYYFRGISKFKLGDKTGACSDWEKASSLGDKESAKWVSNQC